MCLYPRIIKNRKYQSNKKNGGIIPECEDERMKYVPIGCGKCKECRKQKKRNWQVRLHEEIKVNKGVFVTLTFSNEGLETLCKKYDVWESNAAATIAVRRFLERWRKENKKSVRHWFITEMGHHNTKRIHLHGILFTNDVVSIVKHWKYGNVTIGKTTFKPNEFEKAHSKTSFVSARTINYIVKYMTKIDEINKGFEGVVLCSAGIGKNYMNTYDATQKKYKKEGTTDESYRLNNGAKIALPVYYRNKIYSEKEREKLWIEKLDKEIIYINGKEYKNRNENDIKLITKALEIAQLDNIILGYGDDSKEWKKKNYNITQSMLRKAKKEIEYQKYNIDLRKN